jgi:hypothetical protein
VQEDLEDRVDLRPGACISIIPSSIPKSKMQAVAYTPKDLPDMGRCATEISNVCGFVAGFSSLYERHPAWRSVRSTLGCFREAYSLRGGNLLFLRGKLIFKGATDRDGVMATVIKLTSSPAEPVLKAYLIIGTAYMRRNLFVHRGCLLEEMLWKFPWCKVMFRWYDCERCVPIAEPDDEPPGTRSCPTRSYSTSGRGTLSSCPGAGPSPTSGPSRSPAAAWSTCGSGGTTAWSGRGTGSGWGWWTGSATSF